MNLDTTLIGKTIAKIYPSIQDASGYQVDEQNIDYNGGAIVVEFTDKTKVYVWNSEWGGISTKEE